MSEFHCKHFLQMCLQKNTQWATKCFWSCTDNVDSQIKIVKAQNLLLQFYMSYRKQDEHLITDNGISIFVSQDLD